MSRERWEIYNQVTERRAGIQVFETEAAALRTLLDWWVRDRVGGRPDVHEYLPWFEVRRVRD